MRKVVSYLTLGCNDLDRAVAFYDPVLGALGMGRLWLQNGWAAYGPEGDDHGTVLICPPFDGQAARAGNGVMIGLHAESAAEVDAFHAAALAHGGSCEGPPGPRASYGEGYYLAYVRDPTGNKLSAFYREGGSLMDARISARPEATALARDLRSATSLPEGLLWRCLRGRKLEGLRFRRQHPAGPIVLDFYCPALRLAIEIDGDAHGDAERKARDQRRDAWLAERGVQVLRIQARTVLYDMDAALRMILHAAATPITEQRAVPPP